MFMGIKDSYLELKPWTEFSQGKWFSAEDAREVILGYEAAELEQDVAFVHNNLGMALELGGQQAEAIESYRTASSLDGDHATAMAHVERLAAMVPVKVDTEDVVARLCELQRRGLAEPAGRSQDQS